MTSQVASARSYFSSESVTEGHPDKVCDAVLDAILDAVLGQDPMGRVACETLVTKGRVTIAGEVTSLRQLEADLKTHVVSPVLERYEFSDDVPMLFNPSGRFVVGGPTADTGLSGRTVIVDTYGGYARHGGEAFSGKDVTKVDRSAAYGARHAAKNVVPAGLATRCELQLAYAIGRATPFSVFVETFGTAEIDPMKLTKLVSEFFDSRPGAIIERLRLRRPSYRPNAAYGHFGRSQFPWESTELAPELARAAGDL